MPGLLRGVARTAAIAGTATAVSNRVSRRQANRWAAQDAPQAGYGYDQAPPPQQMPVDDGPDVVGQLRELGKLRDDGILTEEEFAAEKHKILG
jgi:hypothetical protein